MKHITLWVFALLSLLLIACNNTTTQIATTITPSATTNTQQTLSTLKNTTHFLKSALAHIFEGEINSKDQAVGYHYEGLASAKGKVIESTRSKTDKNGIYRAKITIDNKEKNAYSSFFPKTWSAQQVVDAINEAYDKRELQSGNIYNGKISNGMTIQMYLTDQNKIISAFPLYDK